MGSKKQKKEEEEVYINQLLTLFPNGDPEYFRTCLGYYKDNHVERIAEKFTVYYGTQYPKLPHKDHLRLHLKTLALDIFPQCDVGFLRDQLLRQPTFYRIENIIDYILSRENLPERLEYGKLDPSEEIKSDSYKVQAQVQLSLDFPSTWKSSIRAVLAENNWDYIKSYDQLNELGSGGFLNMLKNFVIYFSKSSPSAHLDKEYVITNRLLKNHIHELNQRSIRKQIEADKTLAHEINITEYTENEQLITCDCCYSDYAFEQLSFCTEGEHSFCHDCICHYITEGLFGQGTLRGKPRIQCISSTDECKGCFSTQMLKLILSDDVWKAYENSLLEDFGRGQQRLQCCGCPYFELEESIKPLQETMIYKNSIIRTCLQWFMWDFKHDLEIAHARIAKSRRGSIFVCQNKKCKTLTCLDCFRPVRGSHKCWEKEADGLRLYVEKAMVDAVKRTCPNCSLSFQKSDGCNKITCNCGYIMCYVCRKDIGQESYGHFCNHFRERPGTKCNKCKKCDLYKTEPENDLVEKAATKARKQYIQAHPELKEMRQPNIIIGPKTTFDTLDEWKHASVIWCLEKGLRFIV